MPDDNKDQPLPAFDCRMCGHCCEGAGGIVMTLPEQERICVNLGLSLEEFRRLYTVDEGGKVSIRTKEDGFCVFFEERCRIHAFKPDVCRAWPFFRGNLIDAESWTMAQDYCPGIRPEAGHAEFVRQGREYLRANGLTKREAPDAPNALVLDDE